MAQEQDRTAWQGSHAAADRQLFWQEPNIDAHRFESLQEAHEQIETWRREYNESRPHRALAAVKFPQSKTIVRVSPSGRPNLSLSILVR